MHADAHTAGVAICHLAVQRQLSVGGSVGTLDKGKREMIVIKKGG